MNRLFRLLIVILTLGRFKWFLRLTWISRLIVFLGVTAGLAKIVRRVIGLDKPKSAAVDSAWADALRYTPPVPKPDPATTPSPVAESRTESVEPTPTRTEEISESTSEVIGTTDDGSTETITIHEIETPGESESIVRIESPSGEVETVVTDAPVEEIDLANLGSAVNDTTETSTPTVAEADESSTVTVAETEVLETVEDESSSATDETPATELEEIVEETSSPAEGSVDIEIVEILEEDTPVAPDEILETEILEIIESVESVELESGTTAESAAKAESPAPAEEDSDTSIAPEMVLEPLETTDEDPDPDIDFIPDWIRGDGTNTCPGSHPVKAKATSMIYYEPESGHYERTIPDVCFASAQDAEAAGYRAPRR